MRPMVVRRRNPPEAAVTAARATSKSARKSEARAHNGARSLFIGFESKHDLAAC